MRKEEHIKIALQDEAINTSLDNYRIEYNSIPLFGIDDVDVSTIICGYKFEYPFFINAITAGGSYCNGINKDLLEVCKKCNIEFFPGSYSVCLKNEEDKLNYPKNYSLNIGIDKNYSLIKDEISYIKPRFLQVHTNPLQEMVMSEGDKNFNEWFANLKEIKRNINIPIILKETGFGMNENTIKLAIDLNIDCIDISGKDGTNFSKIENKRKKRPSHYLDEIGYTTAQSLKFASKYKDKIDIVASGGIRNPLDVIKCLSLGAKAVGVSRYFLDILLNKGKEELILEIEKWKLEIKYLMILTNSKNIDDLYGKVYEI